MDKLYVCISNYDSGCNIRGLYSNLDLAKQKAKEIKSHDDYICILVFYKDKNGEYDDVCEAYKFDNNEWIKY